MNFDGKTVLVTGAAVGIGRAVALRMAELGANVILADLQEDLLLRTAEELSAHGDRILPLVCDVSDPIRVREVVREGEARFGKIDILVNNAGLWRHWGSFLDTSDEIWEKYLSVNLMGAVWFTKAVLEGMISRRYGRIVNVASVAGVYGNGKMVAYSATKGAMISMTKALAKEVSEFGVTVNSISPGSVNDSSDPDITATAPSEFSFSKRTGSNLENANLICFLASDGAAYISGENIMIDGCRKKM
jgi:NAD(P)-dependent dehydrogenase (short-subunit alcohol dehydrogenase family)